MTRFLRILSLALLAFAAPALADPFGNIRPTDSSQPNLASTQGSGHYTTNHCLIAADGKGSIGDFGATCATSFGVQTSIASASTTDLGTLTTNSALVTGTTTITSFGSSASTSKAYWFVQFDGALTITYNASSLITPTGANITTAANGFALLYYRGSGNWTVLSYQPPATVITPPTMHSQTFTSSGTFTIPASATSTTPFRFSVFGGAGGGGSNSGGSGGGAGAGGSGCAAGYVLSGFTAGQNATITIGSGGTGSFYIANNGTNGTATTLAYNAHTVFNCGGGNGGTSGSCTNTCTGGAAGALTTDFTGLTTIDTISAGSATAGGIGAYAGGSEGLGGAGGSNPMGIGGVLNVCTAGGPAQTGANGVGFGAGGAGGCSSGGQSTGGNGTSGGVIISWVL